MKSTVNAGRTLLLYLLRPEVPILISAGFLAGAALALFSLRYQGLIHDGMASLIGAFLGAVVTVVGALTVTKIDHFRKLKATRKALRTGSEKIVKRFSARVDRESKADPSRPSPGNDIVLKADRDFVMQHRYVVEGLIRAVHDVDLDVLPNALELAAALRQFEERSTPTVRNPAVRMTGGYKALGAAKEVLSAATALKASLIVGHGGGALGG